MYFASKLYSLPFERRNRAHPMTEVILPIVLATTLTKTVLVVDVVCFSGRGLGFVARTAKAICSRTSQAPKTSRGVSGPSKIKSLHHWLLGMHVTTVVNQSAAVAKYFGPVSDTSCVVNQRIMLVFTVLFDATMVMFLLSRALVVIDNRTLACWEKIIIWWSRMYACVYLGLTAVYLGVSFPVSANPEGRCVNGLSEDQQEFNTLLFSIQKILLVIQGVLLLGMFIRPLLGRVEGMQSGGSLYRSVVLRNVICTVGIVTAYAVKTIVVRESAKSNQIGRDLTRAFTGLATLILTEIALPIGFSSVVKAFSKEILRGSSTRTLSRGGSTRSGAAVACTLARSTNAKVSVPVQELKAETP